MKRIPQPFRVKDLGKLFPNNRYSHHIYEVNGMAKVILREASMDKQLITVRCADRNALFKAGAEWAIKELKSTRSKNKTKRRGVGPTLAMG